jgi:hypothetical protein
MPCQDKALAREQSLQLRAWEEQHGITYPSQPADTDAVDGSDASDANTMRAPEPVQAVAAENGQELPAPASASAPASSSAAAPSASPDTTPAVPMATVAQQAQMGSAKIDDDDDDDDQPRYT